MKSLITLDQLSVSKDKIQSTFLECSYIYEFGIPVGKEGRKFILSFIKEATQKKLNALWINTHAELSIYPPAWLAWGVSSQYMFYIDAQKPVKECKRALINPLFKVIVLDLSKGQISKDDLSFLRYNARFYNQCVILIRNYWLSNKLGNTWAKMRINVFGDEKGVRLKMVKGKVEGLNNNHVLNL